MNNFFGKIFSGHAEKEVDGRSVSHRLYDHLKDSPEGARFAWVEVKKHWAGAPDEGAIMWLEENGYTIVNPYVEPTCIQYENCHRYFMDRKTHLLVHHKTKLEVLKDSWETPMLILPKEGGGLQKEGLFDTEWTVAQAFRAYKAVKDYEESVGKSYSLKIACRDAEARLAKLERDEVYAKERLKKLHIF